MCQCDKCYWDACALVLNTMRPHYVTTEKGLLLTMLSAEDYQFKADLAVSILHALKTVKEFSQALTSGIVLWKYAHIHPNGPSLPLRISGIPS